MTLGHHRSLRPKASIESFIFLLYGDGFNDFVYVNADLPRQRQLGQGIDYKHDNAPNSKEENALRLHDGVAIVTDASRGSQRGTS